MQSPDLPDGCRLIAWWLCRPCGEGIRHPLVSLMAGAPPCHTLCTIESIRMQETTLADLQQGRNNLQRELNERTGQLKALVKENFDHFISCKTTIDDIHKRLREAEKGLDTGNSSYVSTHDVIETVSEVGCWVLDSDFFFLCLSSFVIQLL